MTRLLFRGSMLGFINRSVLRASRLPETFIRQIVQFWAAEGGVNIGTVSVLVPRKGKNRIVSDDS